MGVSSKPYNERTDLEKLQSQWWKLSGLHSRQEWSAAVVRAATAAEISANIAIRLELQKIGTFPPGFVDSLLKWANGLSGKIDRLLLPVTKGTDRHEPIKQLKIIAHEINTTRNGVAHSGEFCNQDEGQAAIKKSRVFVEGLVRLYDPQFKLVERDC